MLRPLLIDNMNMMNLTMKTQTEEGLKKNIASLIFGNQSIDFGEYEWGSISDASCELGLNVVHAYATQPNVVEESTLGLDEFGKKTALVDCVVSSMPISNLNSFATFIIGSTSHVTRDDSFHINNI